MSNQGQGAGQPANVPFCVKLSVKSQNGNNIRNNYLDCRTVGLRLETVNLDLDLEDLNFQSQS